MSEKNKSGKLKRAFSVINEKICFSKEISSIGSVSTVRLLKGGAAKFLNYIGRIFAYASTRTYGSFLLSFGLVSLFLQFAEFYFKSEPGDAISYIIISAVIALLGIPLLMLDRPMCIAIQDFAVTDYIFFEFLSIKRMHRDTETVPIKTTGGILLGFIPAAISFFLPIQYVILGLFLLTLALVAFTTPEFPMILTILLLPYVQVLPHSEMVLVCISLITFASYALKVVLGKRVYNFSLYDIILVLFGIACIVSGFLGAGVDSLRNSLIFAALLLVYVPASNLIVNRRLADLAINAVVISSIPISLLAVIEFLVESAFIKHHIPVYSTSGISVFFTTSEALAAFLLISSVLSAAYAIEKRKRWKKTVYVCVFMAEVGVLGLIMQPFAWISVILGLAAYFIITSKNLPMEALIIPVILPMALFLIPEASVNSVYKFLKISPEFTVVFLKFTEAFELFILNPWFGVGIGDASYNAASGAGTSAIVNTPIGIGVELGSFALVLFAVLILLLFRRLSYFRRFMTNSVFVTVKDMSALAITVTLIYGSGVYIFDDRAVMCLFFIVFGICNSVMRSAKQDHDDRLSYYGDSRSAESSAIDIDMR